MDLLVPRGGAYTSHVLLFWKYWNALIHYENTPIQIHWKFHHHKKKKKKKNWKFSDKKSGIFHISAQNIDCGYSLKPPRGSNEYLQSMFFEQK